MTENKKSKKSLLIVVLLLIIMITMVGGTIAWLTNASKITNSFTIGTFEIPTTSPTDSAETISIDGNLYEPSWKITEEHKLLPGVTFAKDPYVGIGKGSEDAVVYVYVENNFSNKVYFTINTGWEAVDGYVTAGFEDGTYTNGLFKYTAGLTDASSKDVWTEEPIFSSVKADDTATAVDFEVEDGKNMEITVSSFIHQAKDGEGNPIDNTTILNAAKAAFGI